MEIAIIVAIDQQRAIGKDGDQLAYISGDLKRFKQLTTGNAIVMGRKTFEALPKGALPNRLNIVVSRNKDLQLPGCIVVSSTEEAVEAARDYRKLFVIGGGEIYKAFLPYSDTLHLTVIHHNFEGADTWFPEWSAQEWHCTEKSEVHTDEKSGLLYHYETLVRTSQLRLTFS